MQNENAQHDHYNDEIDLADLVRSLWDGKWLVIGVTFLTTLLAVAYLMLVPKTYTGSLEIAALPTAQADAYTELNATKFIEIDKEKLLSLFVEDLKLYYSIDKFIFKNQYITQDSDETDSEFSFRLRQTAYNFSFTPPSAT
ncbi:MAG: Wzz/FepE/Etk N-terminal domain-containing protein, partial [Oceanospirillaceae bacterium]|nr:Wzz/FepE/Etk N-terminal domain-containing protein [Oceanospirillaceae bacterium]